MSNVIAGHAEFCNETEKRFDHRLFKLTTIPIRNEQRYPVKLLNYKMSYGHNLEMTVKLGMN